GLERKTMGTIHQPVEGHKAQHDRSLLVAQHLFSERDSVVRGLRSVFHELVAPHALDDSVAFAVRHPERVSHLILYGGFARGAYRRAKNELELQKVKALAILIRTGWGDESPAFRQLFSALFMPGGTPEQLQKFAERQRKTTSAECAYRYFET